MEKEEKIWRLKDYIMICKRQESNRLFVNSRRLHLTFSSHRYEWFSGTNSGRWWTGEAWLAAEYGHESWTQLGA